MTEHTDETPEPTAEQRRAELPGLGYTDKFAHGEVPAEEVPAEEDPVEEDPVEDGEPDPPSQASPSPATSTAPPPAAEPWTLSAAPATYAGE